MVLFASFQLSAQNQRVSGTVTDAEGNPLGGVTVILKGNTSVAALTNVAGEYWITVPTNGVLEFSFLGMQSQAIDVQGRAVINVKMDSGAVIMENVVVTALGMAKSEKALSYSANQISSDEITRAGERSLLSAAQGKFAGVNISTSSGAPGASNRVVLRGYKSISGSNEPLWIVDGIPISNGMVGSTTLGGGGETGLGSVDFGNRGNDINSDDIESMSLLKGAAASALYGSRAANGVIIITTKSGEARDKVKIEYSNDTKFTRVAYLPQMQNRFGQGWYGHDYLYENGSWGPKFTGEARRWGNVVNGEQLYKNHTPLKTNLKDFYDTGLSETNSINVSGGKDNTTFFMSYANTYQNGVLPTDNDYLKRNAVSMRGSTKGKIISASASVNYINKKVSQAAGGQGYSVYNDLMQVPRDISLVDMKDYNAKFYNINDFYTPFGITNPYYTLEEDGNRYNEDHIFGNIQLSAKLTKWLEATVRAGNDYVAYQREQWRSIAIASGANAGQVKEAGAFSQGSGYSNEFNFDAMLQFNPYIGDNFGLSGIAGYNLNARRASSELITVEGLDLPKFYNLSNSSSTPSVGTALSQRRLIGAYLNLDFDFKSMVFLNFAMRNDWSSTLPPDGNSYFYPSIGLSASLTDIIPVLKKAMTFAKIRASYGETGNDASAYSLKSVMVQSTTDGLFGGLSFPLAGVNAYKVADTIGNPSLKPERTKEFEVGFDFRFLDNRIGIDFTYYNGKSIDQILNVPIAASSGYLYQWMNLGTVSNKGIEIALTTTPVRTNEFRWDLNFTFARNRNLVVELSEGLEKVALGGVSTIGFYAAEGMPLGYFEGQVAETTVVDGVTKYVVDAYGVPIAKNDKEYLGDIESDFTAGIYTALSWRGLTVSAQIDGRKGGLMYSRTADINHFVGNAPETLYNDREPWVIPNSVQRLISSDGATTIYYENNTPLATGEDLFGYWDAGGLDKDRSFLVDRTNIRLREVVVSYNFPKAWFNKTPVNGMQLSFIGTNLWMWRPDGNRFIDPEASTFGNNLSGEFGEFSTAPSVRSYGFNLKLTF